MSLAYTEGIRRPELKQFWAINIHCEDCGRTKRMPAGEINRHVNNGVHTLMDLYLKMRCTVCSERGIGGGKNISLYPFKRGER